MVFSKWFEIWPRFLESQLALTQDLKLKEVMYFFVFRKISFYSFSIRLFGRKIRKIIIWRTFKAMYPRLVNKNNVFFFRLQCRHLYWHRLSCLFVWYSGISKRH